MTAAVASILLSLGAVSFGPASGYRPQDEARANPARGDASLAPYQAELLEIAFQSASAMPLQPHIKNRSRAQEAVVVACLELDQPRHARAYVDQIANWRRGTGYADLALHYARQGAADKVESCLQQAAHIAAEAQDWRRDRIKAKIAAARVWLDKGQGNLDRSLASSEWGPTVMAKAMACSSETFDETMGTLDKLASGENFDILKAALQAYAELHRRFYVDPERRLRVERKIRTSWGTMPVFLRIELLMALADASLAHDDQAKALGLLGEARALMDAARWQPRSAIPLMAALARRRFRAGDEVGGRSGAQAALDLFEARRETIANIYRGQMLRPVAEAFHAMGDAKTALHLYRRAVEAGMENPNSRPRADDLVATCCSMATHGVEPDAVLESRIREIFNGLGDPW